MGIENRKAVELATGTDNAESACDASGRNLDPRTKILIGLLSLAAVFAARSPFAVFSQSALVVASVLFFREIRAFPKSFKLVAPMTLLVFFVSLLSFDLEIALLLAARLFNLLTVSFLLFRKLTPEELAGGLAKMKVPFVFVFILSTGLRFVPLMQSKIKNIREAQMSRGIDLRFRLKNAGNFMALLGPLLAQSFILADELAVAIEVRGFGRKNRSYRKSYRFRKRDYVAGALAICAFAAFIWLQFKT